MIDILRKVFGKEKTEEQIMIDLSKDIQSIMLGKPIECCLGILSLEMAVILFRFQEMDPNIADYTFKRIKNMVNSLEKKRISTVS